jgi:hypothetical protein
MLVTPPTLPQFSRVHTVGIHPELLRKHSLESISTSVTHHSTGGSQRPACGAISQVVLSTPTLSSTVGELTDFLKTLLSFTGRPRDDTANPIMPTPASRSITSHAPQPSIPPEQEPASLPPPSPTLLSRFVEYSVKKGISDAEIFQPDLELRKVGPDIIHDIFTDELMSIGFASGDVSHLKKRASDFMDCKRQRLKRLRSHTNLEAVPRSTASTPSTSTMTGASTSAAGASTSAAALVTYRYTYEDGGKMSYSASPLRKTGRVQLTDFTKRTLYRDEGLGAYLPILQGYKAPMPSHDFNGSTQEEDKH